MAGRRLQFRAVWIKPLPTIVQWVKRMARTADGRTTGGITATTTVALGGTRV